MQNPNRAVVTHIVFPTLCRYFQKIFCIEQSEWGVIVKWGKEGLLFSCPRDLRPDKHLCEMSFVTKDQTLTRYFDGPPIYWVRDVQEMIHLVYRSFLKYNLLDKINIYLFQFHLTNKLSKWKKQQTLFSQCALRLSTLDRQIISNFQM
jgi:hypothetical protein